MSSLYDRLGVSRNAKREEILKAYKRMRSKHHPDHGGKKEDFHAVEQAMIVLGDPAKRSHYDSTGDDGTPKPPTEEQQAMAAMQQIFIQIMQNWSQTESGDPVAALTQSIITGQLEGPKQVAGVRRQIKAFEKALRKLKQRKTAKQPFLQEALKTRIASLNVEVSQMEHAVKLGVLMLALLRDYDWEADPVASYGSMFAGLHTGSPFFKYNGP